MFCWVMLIDWWFFRGICALSNDGRGHNCVSDPTLHSCCSFTSIFIFSLIDSPPKHRPTSHFTTTFSTDFFVQNKTR